MTPAGQIDYSAANAYQNALASQVSGVTSVAWPGWRNIGMAAQIADPSLREHAASTGVDPDDAMACLASILASGVPTAIVSPVNVQSVLRANAAGITASVSEWYLISSGEIVCPVGKRVWHFVTD